VRAREKPHAAVFFRVAVDSHDRIDNLVWLQEALIVPVPAQGNLVGQSSVSLTYVSERDW
jgi:hypothetical protein